MRRFRWRRQLLLACFLPGLLGCGGSSSDSEATTAESRRPRTNESKPVKTSNTDVPIGGVIMWWGSKDQIPANFELCDGQEPATKGAVLKGSKPDLRDRFIKGPQQGDAEADDLGTGGADQLDLSHTHGSSKLAAQIGTHDQRQFVSLKSRGRGFTDATWQLRAESARRAAGGPNNATAISGETDTALDEKVDNRPVFQEMFFIIRVK